LDGFIDSVAEEDLDRRKNMKYPDSLSVSGIEYAKFEFKDNTDEKEWFFAITKKDYEIRNAWIQRFG
ncbi:hypothetical protein IWQ61_010652, partial [Dispira simplex]